MKLHHSIDVLEFDGINESGSYMLYVLRQEAMTECGQPESKVFKRSSNCFYLWTHIIYVKVVIVKKGRKEAKAVIIKIKTPAKRNAPLSKARHERVTLALK